jgi:hypothetical protein
MGRTPTRTAASTITPIIRRRATAIEEGSCGRRRPHLLSARSEARLPPRRRGSLDSRPGWLLPLFFIILQASVLNFIYHYHAMDTTYLIR